MCIWSKERDHIEITVSGVLGYRLLMLGELVNHLHFRDNIDGDKDIQQNNTGDNIRKLVLKQIPSFKPYVDNCAAFCTSALLRLFCLTSKDLLYNYNIADRDVIQVVLDIPEGVVGGERGPEIGAQEESHRCQSKTGCFCQSAGMCTCSVCRGAAHLTLP
jgi:hypothetical protein